MSRLAAFTPVFFLILAAACLSVMPTNPPSVGGDFAWVRPVNDYEQKFRDARILAEQIMQHPMCRVQFEKLPDWPTGNVPTEIIYGGGISRTTRAFTNMRTGEIFLLIETVRASSTEYLARTLIHELAHAASKSDYEAIRKLDEKKDLKKIKEIQHKNEMRVQKVVNRCMQAARIA